MQHYFKSLILVCFLPIFISSGQSELKKHNLPTEAPPAIEKIGKKSDVVYRLAEEISRLQNQNQNQKQKHRNKKIIKYIVLTDTIYLKMTPKEKDSLIVKLAATIRDSMQPKFVYIDRPILVEKKKKRGWLRRMF